MPYYKSLHINLKNVGDAPAINIYTIASIQLPLSLDADGNINSLSAALLPSFVQSLSVMEDKTVCIHFETTEVKILIQELKKAFEINLERIKTSPTQHHIIGAFLNIQIMFKNMMGQWCESTISYEIAWLEYINPPKRKTNNINENTIPPKQICKGDMFKAILCSNHLAPFSYKMVPDDYIEKN